MQNTNEKETTLLISHHSYPKPSPFKFPLGLVPASHRPYLELIRLEKPTGTILMFWPCAWGLTMAAFSTGVSPTVYLPGLANALVGAFLLRSSACTVNDIFDREMDAGVERTKCRPLPSGRVSVCAASVYLAVQYALGAGFFYLTTSGVAFYVALFQLFPLFAIYPLLKRITYWPQAWLGLAMNFGFITSWLSVSEVIPSELLATAMLGFWCWTMLYDTIYACQDIQDDVKVGVRSTAILFGSWIRPLLIACGMTFVSMLALAGALNNHGPAYFVISVAGTALHLLWQAWTVDLEEPKSCWENFNRNGQLGWIVWAGMALDYALALNSLAAV
ncbi:4-hydroxybenzoate polyprenyltransferase, mitochondrial [Mycena kentingensis (nom. inval.)]|nr:4-hydroxybenzoate polyprenyltransferase, mitochondrial [Mycena kentingensis (nom. inval.)]